MSRGHVLIAYHRGEGHTDKIANFVADILREHGVRVAVLSIHDAPADLDCYDVVVVGGSVELARFHHHLAQFIRHHRRELASRPSAFFSVSMHASHRGHAADALSVLWRFLERLGWKPDAVAAFGCGPAYRRYGVVWRRLARWTARHEGLGTDMHKNYDVTDWGDVRLFAEGVNTLAHGVRS